jgi:uncharacterized protein (DUF885 family)
MGYYQQISDAFLGYLKDDVEGSVALGLPDNLGRLADPSLQAHKRELTAARELLAQIDDTRVDDFYRQLDLQLIQRYLQQDIFFRSLRINEELQRCQKPGGVDGISAGIFQLFVNDQREPEQRLGDVLSRLQQAPSYLSAELETLTTPVTRWRDIEVEQGEELPELFETIFQWAVESKFSQLEELRQHIELTNSALGEYLDALRNMRCRDAFAIGEAGVEELLALKQIEKSPEQLRQMAADYMAETLDTIESLRQRLLAKYQLDPGLDASALHEFLKQKFAVDLEGRELSALLEVYQGERENIGQFIASKKLFPLPPNQDIKIMMTPGFLQPVIPAGAMWPPLALREGVKTSLVYLTLREDQLGEHTHLDIGMMMVHEGIPGHHLQFATAAGQPSLIRRIFDANEHAEGWTTMLEDYMLDMGFAGDELVDEVRFNTKRDISRLVARVGIDLYFMTGDKHYLDVGLDLDFSSDDPFVNAATLLKAATGFSDGRVQSELNWYSTEQCYPLSYLTGNRLVWELKQDIAKANLKQLPELELDREFHRVYLQSGCMPVTSLRSVFQHEGFLPV